MLRTTDFMRTSSKDKKFGVVLSVADGVARISGLESVKAGEMIEISTPRGSINSIALNLELEQVSALLLDADTKISAGSSARALGQQAGLFVGYHLL